MGGLTAAALLAKAGLEVVVLEAANRPGGYLAGFQRGRFRFDTAIHWLNQCGPEGTVRRLLELLGPGAPPTAQLRRIRRSKSPDFDYLLTDDPTQLRDALVRDAPEDAAGIRRFFAAAEQVGGAFAGLCRNMRARQTMSLSELARYGLAMSWITVPFWRHLGVDAERGLARYFRGDRVKRVFCSEPDLLSCLVPIGWAYTGDYQQPPPGGSQAFPVWLVRCLEAWGGRLGCRAPVEQVLLDGGRAVGVRYLQGRARAPQTLGARWVIAACDLLTLFERMLPKGVVPPARIAQVREAELYGSSVTVSLGLDAPAEALGFDEELIVLTEAGLDRAAHVSSDPASAALNVLAPSLRDPSLAPPGKGTLTIYAGATFEHGDRWRTGPGLERGADYKAFKARYADVLIDRVARAVSPNLREHIELMEVATPVTHLRYTGNHGGTIMAQKPSRPNMRNKLASYATPVDRLLLGGHWAEYGGGVPVAVRAGLNSALLVLQRERRDAFRSVCAVLDGRRDPRDVEGRALRPLS
jgi:prolycopene isomerase